MADTSHSNELAASNRDEAAKRGPIAILPFLQKPRDLMRRSFH